MKQMCDRETGRGIPSVGSTVSRAWRRTAQVYLCGRQSATLLVTSEWLEKQDSRIPCETQVWAWGFEPLAQEFMKVRGTIWERHRAVRGLRFALVQWPNF